MRIFIVKHPHPLVLRKMLLDENFAKLILYCETCKKEMSETIAMKKEKEGV